MDSSGVPEKQRACRAGELDIFVALPERQVLRPEDKEVCHSGLLLLTQTALLEEILVGQMGGVLHYQGACRILHLLVIYIGVCELFFPE